MPSDELTAEDVKLIRQVARGLIARSANCRRAFGTEPDNYLGIGYLGLLKARRYFDSSRGVRWEAAANWLISRTIRFEALREQFPVHVPVTATHNAFRSTNPVDNERTREIRAWLTRRPVREFGQTDWEPKAPSDNSVDSRDEVERYLRVLSPTRRQLVNRIFGLDGEPADSMTEYGRRTGRVASSVSLMFATARRHMTEVAQVD
jgi:hypothetical protein